jgi:hypothetical protein
MRYAGKLKRGYNALIIVSALIRSGRWSKR